MKDILAKFGGNFIVSSFVPALAFLAVSMIVFDPVIPAALLNKIQSTLDPFGEGGLFLISATIVLGFTLHSLNTFIYKLFEGYHVLAHLPWLLKMQKRKYQKLESRLKEVEENIKELETEEYRTQNQYEQLTQIESEVKAKIEAVFPVDHKQKYGRLATLLMCVRDRIDNLESRIVENESHLKQMEEERYYIMSQLDLRFPFSEKAILPTGFGNILRAAEAYASDRYGIDSVRLWPQLVHVIPDSYYEKVEQSNNGLAFLINCSVLSLLLGLMSIFAAGYQYYLMRMAQQKKTQLLHFVFVESKPRVYLERTYLYGVVFVFALGLFFFFYRGSFPLVMQYGNMIRSSYDLFRMQLLTALSLELPEDSNEERDTWSKVSEFIAVGDRQGPLLFEYQIPTEGSDNS